MKLLALRPATLTTLFYPKLSFFKKQELWNYFPCLIFCMIFEEKYFSRSFN